MDKKYIKFFTKMRFFAPPNKIPKMHENNEKIFECGSGFIQTTVDVYSNIFFTISQIKMADLKDSNEERTLVMNVESILFSISSICETTSLAPYNVITPLGDLLLNLTRKDFSLKEHCDNAKLEYIKYPDSFRACLVQVSNGVCDAFDAAHRSMNRIWGKSELIAMDAKSALEVLEKGTHKEWSIALNYLEKARKDCLKCVKTAASITEEFEKVDKTIKELYEACTGSKGKYENERESTKEKIEASDEEMKRIEKSEKNLDKGCSKAENEYEDAVAACPSPWKIIFLEFIDNFTYLTINLAAESLKQKMMSHFQVYTGFFVSRRVKSFPCSLKMDVRYTLTSLFKFTVSIQVTTPFIRPELRADEGPLTEYFIGKPEEKKVWGIAN